MRIGITLRHTLHRIQFVPTARKHFAAILGIIGNIAATNATLLIGLGEELSMTNEQFERERRYRVAISVAAAMLKQGLVTEDEYCMINKRMIEKYKPFFGGLVHLLS